MTQVIAEILEVTMLLCFGASWPFNVIKSLKARTTKGKSLLFLCLIIVGYIAGIIAKILTFDPAVWVKWLSLGVYIINLIMVSTDLFVYFRNYKLDKLAEKTTG